MIRPFPHAFACFLPDLHTSLSGQIFLLRYGPGRKSPGTAAEKCATELQPGENVHRLYTGNVTAITLLMTREVLPEHGIRAIFFRHFECTCTEPAMFLDAAQRRRRFSQYCGCIFGDLNQFSRDKGIEPEKVFEHLLQFIRFHTIIGETLRLSVMVPDL